MSWPVGWERRAVARLRSRGVLLGIVAVGALSAAALLAASTDAAERAEAILQAFAFGSVMSSLIVAHGMVSADLRSGVAVVWLQKPVHPVAFYLSRALDTTTLVVCLVLALGGFTAGVVWPLAGGEAARAVLAATPNVAIVSACLAAMTFGFSGWGAPVDSLLALAFAFGSIIWSALGGERTTRVLTWVVPPVEAIGTLGDFLGGESPAADPLPAALRVGAYVLAWAAVGAVGLSFSTRSPLPSETLR